MLYQHSFIKHSTEPRRSYSSVVTIPVLLSLTFCACLWIRGVFSPDSDSLGGHAGGGGKKSLQFGTYEPTVTPLPEIILGN